ncbi:unnamed protein product [Cylicostephanus goldi]|uniref:Reverse transcriptase domain-containing protein n=1 Tax=Cylicostephanus goldi TaxID=71465 RepID=A0A3P7M630_CYLGO|nr:unnamed protein product [Cylicostephanus goldi]
MVGRLNPLRCQPRLTDERIDLEAYTKRHEKHEKEEKQILRSYYGMSSHTYPVQAPFWTIYGIHSPKSDVIESFDVMTLLKACLDCSVFRWSGQYFRQVRGLAMGQRLAPVVAITFMSKVE